MVVSLFDPNWSGHKAVVFGLEGPALTSDEAKFFEQIKPFGFILFSRNCNSPEQLKALTSSLRSIPGQGNAPILIDQEGGRVARLREPNWRHPPPGRLFGVLSENNIRLGCRAAYINARLIARDLKEVGIDVNCSPILDLLTPLTHSVIGDRAYSENPVIVTCIANEIVRGFVEEGITPVIKHIPGHGRATADSHVELPNVEISREELRKSDFIPFKKISGPAWAMTAHIIFSDIDPLCPATQSQTLISDIIRGEVGFEGVLISDDIGMGALSGNLSDRADKALRAGCDLLLHCSGKLNEMREIQTLIPVVNEDVMVRLQKTNAECEELRREGCNLTAEEMAEELRAYLSMATLKEKI